MKIPEVLLISLEICLFPIYYNIIFQMRARVEAVERRRDEAKALYEEKQRQLKANKEKCKGFNAK